MILIILSIAIIKAFPESINHSVIVLDCLWKFHTGDEKHWSDQRFDDADWEKVDLTPTPGAHDNDVGLLGYVKGWTAKGHPGYSGYAWYRIHINIAGEKISDLEMTGPPDVEDAYQVFANGFLLGSDGDFSGKTPTVYSIRPRIFSLSKARFAPKDGNDSLVIAFRVWVDAGTIKGSPDDAGGIHIAPTIGVKSGIEAIYHAQWLQSFWGYIVDAVEPLLFILLAILTCNITLFYSSKRARRWFVLALLLTACVRANQVLFFWAPYESNHAYDLIREVILTPLCLWAWLMTIRFWFGIENRLTWFPKVLNSLTILFMVCRLFSLSWFFPGTFQPLKADFDIACNWFRIAFLALLIVLVLMGYRQRRHQHQLWLVMPAVILLATGLFAQELSIAHIPGIWFPYGIGVSRTQYAYAGFIIFMFSILIPLKRKEESHLS
nr:glycoside hydrolase [Mucilaginibacter sp. X5P1]